MASGGFGGGTARFVSMGEGGEKSHAEIKKAKAKRCPPILLIR